MNWAPDIGSSTDPIYLAIAKAMAADVAEGRLKPGDRLPTHRELAHRLNVSIGTVTRGYIEAVRRGVIRGETGRGTYVRGAEPMQSVPSPRLELSDDLIDLSLSFPIHAEDPDLAAALQSLCQRTDVAQLLRYHRRHACSHHLEAGAEWARRCGLNVNPDALCITAGAQHALTVILSAVTSPGDLILTEDLTYPGFIGAAQLRHLRLQGIPTDNEGLLPDALAAACRQRNARVLYCMPTIQNPTSAVTSLKRRQEIAEIASNHDLLILEDDAQRLLAPDAPAPISALVPERSFFIANTSKTLAGGLRIAYVAAPAFAREQLQHAIWATVWMLAPLMVELATQWIEDGTADRATERKRKEARARQAMAADILQGFTFQTHPSSYNLWLQLPNGWGCADFAVECGRRGVGVTPGSAFVVPCTTPPPAVRICLGAAENQQRLRTALFVIACLLRSRACCASGLV